MGSRLIPQKSHEILSAQNVIFEGNSVSTENDRKGSFLPGTVFCENDKRVKTISWFFSNKYCAVFFEKNGIQGYIRFLTYFLGVKIRNEYF